MIHKLERQLVQLETYIDNADKTNLAISQASVGWHIEHTLLTIEKICKALIKSEPSAYRWSFRMPRFIVFFLNRIPRGKAKAPVIVHPTSVQSKETLLMKLKETELQVMELKGLELDKFFSHPYFGDLKLKKAIKCLEIHTQHHMNIIEDIIKN